MVKWKLYVWVSLFGITRLISSARKPKTLLYIYVFPHNKTEEEVAVFCTANWQKEWVAKHENMKKYKETASENGMGKKDKARELKNRKLKVFNSAVLLFKRISLLSEQFICANRSSLLLAWQLFSSIFCMSSCWISHFKQYSLCELRSWWEKKKIKV